MVKQKQTARGKSQGREKLIQAAKEIFGMRGYHGTTVDDITKAAGVTRGALYWHFDSKADLLGAIIQELQESYLNRFIEETRGAGDSPMDKLWHMFKFNSRFAVEHPTLIHCLRTLSLEMQSLEGGNAKALFDVFEQQRSFITEIIREAQAKHFVREDLKAEIITSIILAVHDGIVLQLLAFDRHLDGHQVAWALRQITLGGISAGARIIHPKKGASDPRTATGEVKEK